MARFQPGKSGNPTGRPKADSETLEALRSLTPLAVKVLADLLTDPAAKPELRLRAAETVLDRNLGKATQSIDLESAQDEQPGIRVVFVDPHKHEV